VRAGQVVVVRALDPRLVPRAGRVADDIGEQRSGRVAAEVESLAVALDDDVAREHRPAVRGVDLSALDRELRDKPDRVVLPVGEPRVRPRLPVRHADDQAGDQDERGDTDVHDLLVHLRRSRFARLEMSISPASRTKFATTLEPPYETKGSVIPVSGMSRRIPPTMMNVCRANAKVSPSASSFEKPSWASNAIRTPRKTKIM